jgi:hypothetical protein
MALSDQLRKAMADYGTMYAVGRDSGIPATVLGRFVRGERSLTLPTVERLAEFFGMKLTPSTRKPAPYIPPGGQPRKGKKKTGKR